MIFEAMTTQGESLILVGHVHSFPRHPEPGTVVDALVQGYEVSPADYAVERLYALVSVDWATKVTSLDADTGHSSTSYLRGFGTPDGVTWYLSPVVLNSATGRFHLNNGRLARGHRDARLPAELVGLGAPDVVPIHDFPV
ncbi:hypothetical protein Mycsm_06900 (plasmid) [Mycobacterium sp. JS623]|nr:hypothetical protein Mycsm_06900 [Mycobacterium sp. JS623]